MQLDDDQKALLEGRRGTAVASAMRIVVECGRILGAERLIAVESSHVDGALYHGDGGVEFAEMLVQGGAKVAIPTTLNIGALDLMRPDNVRMAPGKRDMARRLMKAYQDLGCKPTWTCAPYQAGHRPAAGSQVAWGESNAVAFCNSVLGARTNRYGDFLDIACAIVGFAPEYGLHLTENRAARILFTTDRLSDALKSQDVFWPVLGALVGRRSGDLVPAVDGVAAFATEDRLKSLGAAAASFGSVALFHIVGSTPEAPDMETALQNRKPETVIDIKPEMIADALSWLTTAAGEAVTAVGVGSPHLSYRECLDIVRLLGARRMTLPFYLNTGRHVIDRLDKEGHVRGLERAGVTLVADTCIVTTPIIREPGGILMTNSGKFAHYAPGNIGMEVVYGSLADCVETAVSGRLTRDMTVWN